MSFFSFPFRMGSLLSLTLLMESLSPATLINSYQSSAAASASRISSSWNPRKPGSSYISNKEKQTLITNNGCQLLHTKQRRKKKKKSVYCLFSRYLSRFFDCLARPNLSASKPKCNFSNWSKMTLKLSSYLLPKFSRVSFTIVPIPSLVLWLMALC